MRRLASTILLAAAALMVGTHVHAHCQIPCGIYDDELRVQLIEEHITTIEKSMSQITALAKETPVNHNQMVRWVENKEAHALEIQHIVTAYFMSQRVKVPSTREGDDWQSYVNRLSLLHQIQVTAMKAKQTTDPAHIATLRSLVAEFRSAYFGEKHKL